MASIRLHRDQAPAGREHARRFPRRKIDPPDRTIRATKNQLRAAGREAPQHRRALDRVEFAHRRGVPDFQLAIETVRREMRAVGGEARGVYDLVMAGERPERIAAGVEPKITPLETAQIAAVRCGPGLFQGGHDVKRIAATGH